MARKRIRDIGCRRAALIRSLQLTLSLDSCSVLGRRQLIVFSEDSCQILRHSCPSNETPDPLRALRSTTLHLPWKKDILGPSC